MEKIETETLCLGFGIILPFLDGHESIAEFGRKPTKHSRTYGTSLPQDGGTPTRTSNENVPILNSLELILEFAS